MNKREGIRICINEFPIPAWDVFLHKIQFPMLSSEGVVLVRGHCTEDKFAIYLSTPRKLIKSVRLLTARK